MANTIAIATNTMIATVTTTAVRIDIAMIELVAEIMAGARIDNVGMIATHIRTMRVTAITLKAQDAVAAIAEAHTVTARSSSHPIL